MNAIAQVRDWLKPGIRFRLIDGSDRSELQGVAKVDFQTDSGVFAMHGSRKMYLPIACDIARTKPEVTIEGDRTFGLAIGDHKLVYQVVDDAV
jgi:hypothetical protein